MAYTDFDFYQGVFFGNQIESEDFPRLAERASDFIRSATQGISDRVTSDADMAQLQKATCAVAEVIQAEEHMTSKAFSGDQAVVSETVGSWSRNYGAANLATAELEYIDKRKREALVLYLGTVPMFSDLFRIRSFRCNHIGRGW